MRTKGSKRALACGLTLAASLIGAANAADKPEDMFRGKTITLYIGFSPGGTYDLFGRMVTRYMAKHIPGQPTMVASNMPGGGSFTASNWLYRVAPKDGTALGTVSQTIAIDDALKSKGVQFKAAEFTWIGRITSNVEIQVVSTRTKGATLEGAREVVVPTASTGPGSPSDTYPKLMNEVAGTKFKIIRGFPGSTDGLLAIERGEVDSSLTSWNTMKTTRMEWLTSKKAVVFVQYYSKRTPELKDVPALVELASNDDDRKLLAFAVSSAEIGRSILGPPGIPAERTAVLRKAFDDTMKDPDLLEEVKRAGLDFEPLDGASLAKIVSEAANVDAKVVARMQKVQED